MNKQLEDFYLHLNESVVTTNDFEEGTKFRKRQKVAEFAYCGLNPMYRHYLSFDLDTAQAAYRYEDVNLPTPTIITINPVNSHCHYLYKLKTPVAYHDNSRIKPQEYFEAVQEGMSQSLQADPAYTHTLTKNPLHDRWKVITHPASYDLSDFLEYIDLPKHPAYALSTPKLSGHGRNVSLFNALRLWGYGSVHRHILEDAWNREVEERAIALNGRMPDPLLYKEVRDTAKATAKWIWKHRFELNTRKRVLEFTDETATERMSKGAQYTNALRVSKATKALQAACDSLKAAGVETTPINLMNESGLNIKTVRKYLPSIIR